MNITGLIPRIALAASIVGSSLPLVAPPAEAISRYNSTSMSCGSIRSAIRAEGAVILRWRSGQRYGRFVANSGYCDPGQRAVTAYVPSADRKSCSVRECKRCDFDDDDFFIRRC